MFRPACVGLLFTLHIGSTALADGPADVARVRAIEALKAARAEEAISILERALERDPGAVELLDLLGRAQLAAGQPARAEESAGRILEAFPRRRSTRLWLAQHLEGRGRIREAMAHYRIFTEDPDATGSESDPARLGLARTLLAAGDPAGAREALEPLLARGPSAAAAGLAIRALDESRQLEAAVDAARRFQAVFPELTPRLAALLHERGLWANGAGDLEGARIDLEEAAALDPGLEVRKDLAHILHASGETEEAIRLLREVLEIEGPVESVAAPLGRFLLETGGEEEALELSRAALELEPGSGSAELLRFGALCALGREGEVLAEAPRLARLLGGETEPVLAVLRGLGRLDRPREALEAWLAAAPPAPEEAKPALARLLARAGGGCLRDGDSERALGLYRRALDLAPDDPAVRRGLGWAEMRSGNQEGALRAWAPLLETGEGSVRLLREAARASHALGRTEEALERAGRGLERQPSAAGLRRFSWFLLDEADRVRDLLPVLDPEVIQECSPDDASTAAAILGDRLEDEEARKLLARWRVRMPEDPRLKAAHARALCEEARLAHGRGDLDRAAGLYRASLGLLPASAAARRGLALVLRAEGDAEGAIELLRAACRQDPVDARSRAWLARVLREEGRLEEARRVLAEDAGAGREPEAALEAARLLGAEGRHREAAAAASALAGREDAREGTAEGALELWADSLTRSGEVGRAVEPLRSLASRRPADERVLRRLFGAALEAWGEQRAVEVIDSLRARSPKLATFDAVLASHFLARGDLDRAAERLGRCLALRPGDRDRWDLLGEIDLRRKDPGEAAVAFRAALALDGADPRARVGLAEVELSRANPEGALAEVQRVIDQDPGHRPARRLRIRAQEALGLPVAALAEWQAAAASFPVEPDLLLTEARLLAAAGSPDAALEEADRVLGLSREGSLAVLLYHAVTDLFEAGSTPLSLFRDHLRALRRMGYQCVTLDQAHRWTSGEGGVPRRAVLIVFEAPAVEALGVASSALAEFGLTAVHAPPQGRADPAGRRGRRGERRVGPPRIEAKRRFEFIETGRPHNLKRAGSTVLSCFRVPEGWDAGRLAGFLHESQPETRVRLCRTRILSSALRFGEALGELDRAAALGAAEADVLEMRARVLLGRGDRPGAVAELEKLLARDPTDPSVREAAESAERPLRPTLSPRIELWWDSDERVVFRQSLRAEGNPLARLRLHGEVGHATYDEPDVDTIHAAVGRLGAELSLEGPLDLEAAVGESWFDGSRDAVLYSGAVRWKGFDRVALDAEAAGGPVETPLGVLEGTRLDTQSVAAALTPTEADQLAVSYRHGFYSDNNLRHTVRWEYSRRLLPRPSLRLGYDGAYDDTRKDARAYYSPEELHLHRAFLRLDAALLDGLRAGARVGGGYGFEEDRERPVLDASLRVRWTFAERFELAGDVGYFRNPGYWSSHAALTLIFRF